MVGYAVPHSLSGGQMLPMPVFAGSHRQMGAGIFSTLKRIAIPIFRKLLPHLVKFGSRAVNVGAGVIKDVVSGNHQNVVKNLKDRSRHELGEMSKEYLDEDVLAQTGSGRKRKRSINKKKQKNKRRKLKHKIGLNYAT